MIDGRLATLLRPGGIAALLRGSAVALVLGKFATLGIGFLTWLVAARLYAPADVGIASAIVSAMMWAVQLALLGVSSSVIALLPRSAEPRRLVASAVLVVGLAATVTALGSVLLAGVFLAELRVLALDPLLAATFLLITTLGALGVLLDQTQTALRRTDHVFLRGLLSASAIVIAVLAGAALSGGQGATSIVLAWLVGSGLGVAVGALQVRRELPSGAEGRPDLGAVRPLLRVGIPNWLLTLVERAPANLLPIVIVEVLSPEANAAWYTAWMMAWVVFVIPTQVGIDVFARIAAGPDRLPRHLRQGARVALALGVPAAIGAAVVGPWVLSLLGPTYTDQGTLPLRILVVAVVPLTAVHLYYARCRATGRLREATLAGAAVAAGSIVSAVVLAPAGGLPAVALGFLAVQLASGGWAAWRLRRGAAAPG